MLYIVNLPEIRAELGIQDTQDDAQLIALGERLQARLGSECNRRFLYGEEIEVLNGGDLSLWLKRSPVTSLISVHLSADQDWTDANLLSGSNGDYRVDFARGQVVYGIDGKTRWPQGWQNIRVRYVGGMFNWDGSACSYVDEDDRQALRRALLMQLAYEWRNKATLGLQSASNQGVAITGAPAKLLPDVEALISKFKRF